MQQMALYLKPSSRPPAQTHAQVGHINICANTREEARAKLALIDPSAAASLRKSDSALAATLGGGAERKPQVRAFQGWLGWARAGSRDLSLGRLADPPTSLHRHSPQVGIIMGSDSDLATMKAAAQVRDRALCISQISTLGFLHT